jgi:AcrR family transcriptional regulator
MDMVNHLSGWNRRLPPVNHDTLPHMARRADARRNHDQLVAHARDLFLSRGTDASLEEVARRAGVGIGTLYRHFPTRTDLIEAVYRDEAERLIELAGRLATTEAPMAALEAWLREVVAHSARYQGIAVVLLETADTRKAIRAAGQVLLDRAGDEVRAGTGLNDLLLLANAIGRSAGADPDLAGRLVGLLLDGVRRR